MVVSSDMVKRVEAPGVLNSATPDLFTRNVESNRLHGFASFKGTGAVLLLEVANTDASRERGFMGRTVIPECCGMLFTELSGGSFWMKGCKVPLDIVFIDTNNKITRIYEMSVDGGKKRYRYGDEQTAIEMSFGFCRRHGIRPGTICNWRTW